ncbi:MAG: hypothetical protein E7110_01705 [Bacteroidales bacterium]|nr:hypothetical protein [Bacteroidales bacterium]
MLNNKGIKIDINSIIQVEHGHYEGFINSFTAECSQLSEEIIGKIVKRTITRFNRNMLQAVCWDDCPDSFNAFDHYCARWYKEELYNAEHIRDCIENFLELEYDALPKTEQMILDYAFHTDDYQTDWNNVLNQLYDAFMVEVNNHCQTKKIQIFLESI